MAKLLLSLLVLSLPNFHTSAQSVPLLASTITPVPLLNVAAQAYLNAHNKARAEVGIESLKWNETLGNAASQRVRYQRDKQACSFANLSKSIYAGNQLKASGSVENPRAAVGFWVSGKKYYNYADNSCLPGHLYDCGSYTQVVWKKSLELGCE